MYEKMFEQAESLFKPMNDMWALNVEVLETLKTKQTDLFNEVVADSVEYANGMAKSNFNIDSMLSVHQTFWESLGDKISTNTQDSFEIISGVPEKFGDFFKETAGTVAAAPVEEKPKAPAKKKSPAKKVAAKPAAAKADKPLPTE